MAFRFDSLANTAFSRCVFTTAHENHEHTYDLYLSCRKNRHESFVRYLREHRLNREPFYA